VQRPGTGKDSGQGLRELGLPKVPRAAARIAGRSATGTATVDKTRPHMADERKAYDAGKVRGGTPSTWTWRRRRPANHCHPRHTTYTASTGHACEEFASELLEPFPRTVRPRDKHLPKGVARC